jgi:hypothetical protein
MDWDLLTNYCRSTERNKELLRHRILLRTLEEATAIRARELEEFHSVKDQEITNLQEEP